MSLPPDPGTRGTHAGRAQGNLGVITDALTQVWTSQGRRFATFEAAARRDERRSEGSDRWIQYLDGELNVRWDHDEEPAVLLPRRAVALPRGAFLGWHAPRRNAVIEVGDVALPDVAQFVLALFEKIVADGLAVRIAARVEQHG